MMKPQDFMIGCAFVALSVASNAQAQGDESAKVEEIVVTAQRRSESLQEVPIAVSAITAAKLDAVGISSTQALGLVTPGLNMTQTSGYVQPRIRGIGSTVNGPGFEPPIATYIDGVYMAAAPASLMTLNNISRVEVLKGPQGTLFGRNATGGLIQVVTKDPQQTPSGDVKLSYANYENVTADAYVTGGITDALAADLALRYEHQGDGWGTNIGTGKAIGSLDHDFAGRAKLLFQPTDETDIRLAVDYADRTSSRQPQKPIDRFRPITFNNPLFGGPFPLGGDYDISSDIDPVSKLKAGGVQLQINHQMGGVSLQSITAFRKSEYDLLLDVDYVPIKITQLHDVAKNRQLSQEFQISSAEAGPLQWVAGLYYFRSNDKNDPELFDFGPTLISPVPFTPVQIHVEDRQLTNSYAGYAQATYEFLPDTNLTLGARYTYEEKRVSGSQDFSIAGFLAATTPVPDPALGLPDELTFKRFNYRIALDHKLTPDNMIYASYSTGFKSGGFNLNQPNDAPYRPESIGALEVGLKSELLDHRVRLNTSGYRYIYKNVQVGRYINSNTSIYNGARAKVYGFDLEGEFVVSDPLSLSAGFAYTHARFESFPIADFVVPVNGCVPVFGGVCTGSADDKTLPFTPTTSFNIGADYRVDIPGGSSLMLNATYYRSGRFYGASDNVTVQPAYDMVNASATWTDPSEHLAVRVWGKNLGDTLYTTTILESTSADVFAYGEPRTYGITVGYHF